MNDLLQATGYAAIVYLLFNYLVSFGSGRPLVEWINPGRKYLPLLAMTLFGGAYTSLLLATRKYKEGHLELLQKLVSEEKAPPEVVGALSFLTFGMALVLLFFWCWWFLPRAPQTFSANPKELVAEYRRALRHYVRWSGGLDFALLAEVRDGQLRVVAEGEDNRAILRGLNRLPGVHTALSGKQRAADIEAQKQLWRKLAADLFGRWKAFDEALLPVRQGVNVGISFDVRYGAVYAEMVEEGTGNAGTHPVAVFLFATTMNQYEVSTLNAAKHFAMLSQALRHIRTGVAKG